MAFTRPVSLCFAFILLFFLGERNWYFTGFLTWLCRRRRTECKTSSGHSAARHPSRRTRTRTSRSTTCTESARSTWRAPPPTYPRTSPCLALSPPPMRGEDEVDADVGETTGPARRGGGIAGFVHGTLCILAFLVMIPSGALVVRYAKATGSSAAINLHRYLQLASVSGRVFRISGLNRYSIGLRKNDDTLLNCTWVTQCSAAYVAMGGLVPSPFSSMWSSDWSKMPMQACATIVCAGSRSI